MDTANVRIWKRTAISSLLAFVLLAGGCRSDFYADGTPRTNRQAEGAEFGLVANLALVRGQVMVANPVPSDYLRVRQGAIESSQSKLCWGIVWPPYGRDDLVFGGYGQALFANKQLPFKLIEMDCVTRQPALPANIQTQLSLERVTVRIPNGEPVPLPVRLHHPPDYPIAEVATALTELWQLVDLPIQLQSHLFDRPAELDLELTDWAALAGIQASLASAQGAGIDIVVAGCLAQYDPLQATTHHPLGYTLRIPGGLVQPEADFIAIQGRDCGNRQVIATRHPQREARLIAHEMGHYLGLGHNPGLSIMNASPFTTGEVLFTQDELATMQEHPFWPR